MNKSELFLDKYRELESLVSEKFRFSDNGSQISRLERLPQFKAVASKIRYCREVRNLLSHNPKLGDEYAVVPSDSMLACLDEIITAVKDPKRCRDVMVPIGRVMYCRPDDGVLETMQKMADSDVSKLPVLQNGRVCGVFSSRVLFNMLLKNPGCEIKKDSRIRDLGDLISLTGPESTYYRFADENKLLSELGQMFDSAYENHIRIRMVFVTSDGSETGRLIGIVTPWEIID